MAALDGLYHTQLRVDAALVAERLARLPPRTPTQDDPRENWVQEIAEAAGRPGDAAAKPRTLRSFGAKFAYFESGGDFPIFSSEVDAALPMIGYRRPIAKDCRDFARLMRQVLTGACARGSAAHVTARPSWKELDQVLWLLPQAKKLRRGRSTGVNSELRDLWVSRRLENAFEDLDPEGWQEDEP